ncbi:hypothetical protein AN958_02386 [Leucoagaricus sp. SymC.cos]|nr:hypothetical protein AN958_02386 [Leucoagaricus sp. SymC.cos]
MLLMRRCAEQHEGYCTGWQGMMNNGIGMPDESEKRSERGIQQRLREILMGIGRGQLT